LETALPIFSFEIGGFPININRDVIVQWVILLILTLSAYLLTRNLKQMPNKKQVVLEELYTCIKGLVKGNMGDSYMKFIPYVGTLVVYLLTLNFTGLVGVKPPTENISVTIGFAISSFLVINIVAMKRNGIVGYLNAFRKPYLLMMPINIIERVTLPISLSLRLFGNMLAATLLIDMIYEALGKISWIAQIGIPILAHSYFDLFDGAIQMLVFTMLTINYIKITSEHH
jgi:F-type H+-transporting ATPase subunit a